MGKRRHKVRLVRFHLGWGENRMKWRVRTSSGRIYYYDPEEVQLVMTGCKLKSNIKTVRGIFEGEKSVCAWILCEKIDLIVGEKYSEKGIKFSSDPMKSPHWTLDDTPVDGIELDALHTIDCGVYLTVSELSLPLSFFTPAEMS